MKNNGHASETQKKLLYDELDLLSFVKLIWNGKKLIFRSVIISATFGLIIALLTTNEFTSTIVVKPILSEQGTKVSGGLGGLAAMAGINIGNNTLSAEINPLLYPKIVESYSYQKELMQSLIFVRELNTNLSFEDYYKTIHRPNLISLVKKYTVGLPGMVYSYLAKNNADSNYIQIGFDQISITDQEMVLRLKEQLLVSVDEEQGYVSISATMPDNIQAAQLVSSAQDILQRKIIELKLKKIQEDLNFVEGRYKENKLAFETAQDNLAKYLDANKNVNTAIAQTEIEKLKSEYQVALSVYSELAKEVENQKIQVKENTPVFAVLKDAVIPIETSNISKKIVLVSWAIVGLILGVMLNLYKIFFVDIKNKWDKI